MNLASNNWAQPPAAQSLPQLGMEACTGLFQVATTRADGYVLSRIRHQIMMMMMKYLWNSQSQRLQILCTCWPREVLTFRIRWPTVAKWAWSRSHDVLKFWQISVNISKTVWDRDILYNGTTITTTTATIVLWPFVPDYPGAGFPLFWLK